ncbi:hypothetical protein CR513_30717, partial [Mucuna pruriens]
MKSRPIILAKNKTKKKRQVSTEQKQVNFCTSIGRDKGNEGRHLDASQNYGNSKFSMTCRDPNMDLESQRETLPIKVKTPGAEVLRRYAKMSIQGNDRRFPRKWTALHIPRKSPILWENCKTVGGLRNPDTQKKAVEEQG